MFLFSFRCSPPRLFAVCCLLLCGLLGGTGAVAQSPYRLTTGREAAWIGGSAALWGGSKWLSRSVRPLTPVQIAALNAEQVPRFDRYSLHHFSMRARRGSDVLLYAAPVLPVLLALDPDVRTSTPAYGVLCVESVAVTTALTSLVKNTARRTRPFVYQAEAPLSMKTQKDARESFFSGHTSTVAAFAFSTAKIWSDHHPSSRGRTWVWVGAAALPLTTGFLRMKAGRHFPTDVLAGFAVGALCGWAVPQLHR